MVEAIALAASLIAVIQLTDRIVGCCRYYIETARDAPSDLRSILIEVSSLRAIFDSLSFLIEHGALPESLKGTLSNRDGPVDGCRRVVEQLENLFPPDVAANGGKERGKRQRVNATLKALAWPLKQSTSRKLLDAIGRHKSTISLALITNTA